jgi:hypothetical protein
MWNIYQLKRNENAGEKKKKQLLAWLSMREREPIKGCFFMCLYACIGICLLL